MSRWGSSDATALGIAAVIILPFSCLWADGQVLISGRLHAQVICCNYRAEQANWILCCSWESGVTQPKCYNQLQLQHWGNIIPTFIFLLSAFCSSEEHPWNYTAAFFPPVWVSVVNKQFWDSQVMSTNKSRIWFFTFILLFSPECDTVDDELLLSLPLLITAISGFALQICLFYNAHELRFSKPENLDTLSSFRITEI